MGQNRRFLDGLGGGPEALKSLTTDESPKKESPETPALESPDVPAMRTMLHTSSERVQLTLTVALLAACAANVALVLAFL